MPGHLSGRLGFSAWPLSSHWRAPVDEVRAAGDAINSLSDRFWNGILDLSPITATVLGYEQGIDRLDDPGPAGRARARALYTDTLAAADAIQAGMAGAVAASGTAGLDAEERITLA